MLHSFPLFGEDGERVTLNVLEIESLHETRIGLSWVVKVTMQSGEKWKIDDPERGVAKMIAGLAMAALMSEEDFAEE